MQEKKYTAKRIDVKCAGRTQVTYLGEEVGAREVMST